LNTIRNLVFAVLCGVLGTTALHAQAAAVVVISGNGQLICEICINSPGFGFTAFDPMVVQVNDAYSQPVPYAQVTWSVANGSAFFLQNGAPAGTSITTTTDKTGQTSALIGQDAAFESAFNFGAVSTINAAAGNAKATFYESQASTASMQSLAYIDVSPNYTNAPINTTITGIENSAGPAFSVSVNTITGSPVQYISLFILNSDDTVGGSPTVPSAYCQAQQGAGQDTVLTNASGVATCNVMFGPVAGSGTYRVVVGGAQPIPATVPDTNFLSNAWSLNVTAPTVGSVKVFSGSPQAANSGTTLGPLEAEVLDTNGNPLSGQNVVWAASPASAITLTGETTSSGSNGIVEVATPVLSATASGTITVTATSVANPSAVATFTITATIPVTISSFNIQNNNETPQTALEGAPFANPLSVVVIGSNAQPINNLAISFIPSGPIQLSSTVATTNSNGVATVTATAESTPGAATVTASVGNWSAVFNLTVQQPGPVLTANSFLNGADGQVGSISPCSIATISGAGVALGGSGLPPVTGPLQYELATDTVSFGTGASAIAAPIFSVSNIGGQPQIMIQVPCEVTPGTVPVTVSSGGGSQQINVTVQPASPGIFQTLMSDGVVRAVIERQDGSFASPTNPARRGESVTAFVTGLGPVSPSVASNALPIWDTPSVVNGTVVVAVNNEGTLVTTAQLSPDIIGVYYVEFTIPNDAPLNNNVVLQIGVIPVGSTTSLSSAPGGSKIPVAE